jgi:hypothetical protein
MVHKFDRGLKGQMIGTKAKLLTMSRLFTYLFTKEL